MTMNQTPETRRDDAAKNGAFGRLLQWRPRWSVERVILLVSMFFALATNQLFWQSAMAEQGGNWQIGLSLALLLIGSHAFLMGLIVWRWNAKVLLTLLLLISALAADYMTRYHVYLDVSILRSVLLTETKEAQELISPQLILPLVLMGLIPALMVWRVQLIRRSWGRALGVRAGFLVFTALLAAGGAILSYQELSALMRNHREVRYLMTPGNYLVGVPRALAGAGGVKTGPREPIGTDAVRVARVGHQKPRLLVIVAGETARAQNWGLNGYARQTTPELAARTDIINFPDVNSCGTNTEVSLPCMFSPLGRRNNYDEDTIRRQQSLLHVLEHAGIGTLWRDNQTGCKGVCEDLPTERMDDEQEPAICANGRCLDEIMLKKLPETVRSRPGDRVIVLHQLGNHGPAYHERYPKDLQRFTPTCDTSDLGKCSQEQIVNSYDNALLYTDRMLNKTIALLQSMTDYDSAMLYVSDHGESLGEKGLYLHGVPYAIAPAEQTRVPMVMWFSPGFAQARGLDLSCVAGRARQTTDHDNLFSSILSLMQVSTSLYDRNMDLFADCAPPVQRGAAPAVDDPANAGPSNKAG